MKQGFPLIGKQKVGILTITYNHSKYIEETLEGFSIQQTDFPFFCFVFDDASTDGEQEILKRWVENHCNLNEIEEYDHPLTIILKAPDKNNPNCVYVIHLQKVNTWGKPVKQDMLSHWEEQCEYIAMCEGDDYWIDSRKLQKQISFMDANQEFSMVCSAGKILTPQGFTNRGVIGEAIELLPKDLIKGFWGYIPTASILYRRSVLESYPEFCKKCSVGDRPLKLYCVLNGRVYYLNEEQVVYRYNNSEGGSWSARFSKDVSMRLAHHESLAQLEYELDVYSQRKYHQHFSRMRALRVIKSINIDPKHTKEVLLKMQTIVPEYKEFLTHTEKIKLFMIVKFPSINILIRKLRNILKQIVNFVLKHSC